MHSAKYKAYLMTDMWKVRRELALWRSGHKCTKCGAKKELEVHHKSYDRLGKERPEDLEVLCSACHAIADSRRRVDTNVRAWNARVTGWAEKRYGEDWHLYHDYDDVEGEFESWLDGHDYD